MAGGGGIHLPRTVPHRTGTAAPAPAPAPRAPAPLRHRHRATGTGTAETRQAPPASATSTAHVVNMILKCGMLRSSRFTMSKPISWTSRGPEALYSNPRLDEGLARPAAALSGITSA